MNGLRDVNKKVLLKDISDLQKKISDIEKNNQKKSEKHLLQQLLFARSLNSITFIASSLEDPDEILEMSVAILGETLKSDRSNLYYVDFSEKKIFGLSQWLNEGIPSTLDTYDLEAFKTSVEQLWTKRECVISHDDDVASALVEDGAADFMHKKLQIKSGLWIPFHFREGGFHLLILNQVTYRRQWQKEELDFLTAATTHLSIALQKIKLVEDHRQAEEKIGIFKSVVEASFDAIGMATEEGKHYYQNEAFSKMFGDISSNPDSVYMDKTVWESVFNTIEKGGRWTGETQMRGAGDRILDILLRAYSTKDENGKITSLIGVHTDITERKKIEENLRENEEKYRTLFELSPSGILLEDKHGNIIEANSAFSESLGYKREEIIGKNVKIFTHPDAAPEVEGNIKKLLSGELMVHEEKNIKKDGSVCFLNLTEKKVTRPNGEDGIICITEDITKRKRIEEALKESEEELRQIQKLEGIGQLAGGIAHDFNNILTAMLGNTEIVLSDDGIDDHLREKLEQVMSSGRNAAKLISNILTFSRKQVIRPEILDVNNTILNLTKTLHRVIGEDIQIELNLNKNISRIKADPTQIEQILINLVVNAKDAIVNLEDKENRKSINIETDNVFFNPDEVPPQMKGRGGEYVLFSVTDSGVGMDKEVIERIFEPYFTTQSHGKGTGLGLSIVYGIIKQNNGSIIVSSEPLKGTSMKVYWPAVKDRIEDEEEADEADIEGGNETILFVEDDDDVREVSEKLLRLYGYRVLTASNGSDAIELAHFETVKIDLLITDMVMPGINGVELSDKMTAVYPGLKVLFCSGYPDDIAASSGREINKELNFIPKPYSSKSLAGMVRKILDSE